ncbi:MAG: glycosyltransferase [Zhenhengia sp.]|uniref:glycosyltransferase n=1 Tax=Zhenhengia sp. TaxID=2944208 RepID=UPI00399255DE
MSKVSIVVPIYNVEKYLDRSIQSLISQSLQDIEIILVNDGSEDNSLAICKNYERRDKRIKVIDKPNGGVSSARNEGIKVATGEYIGFIDPDDWIENNMYEQLYMQITKTRCEVAMCNFVIDDNRVIKEIYLPTDKHVLNKQDIKEWLIPNIVGPEDLNSNRSTIMGSACRLLVKREIIMDQQILFPINIPLMEDLLWCIEIFANSNRIVIDRGLYYHYMKNDNSAVTGYRENMDIIQMTVFNKLGGLLLKYDINGYCENRIKLRYINMIISNIMNEVHKDSIKTGLEKFNNIKQWCTDPFVKDILKEINTRQYTIRKRVTLWALKNGWVSYIYIYYKILNTIGRLK